MSKSRLVHTNKQRPQTGNTLIGIFVGLVLGVVIAAGVVWYLNRSNSPFHSREPQAEKVESPKSASAANVPQELPAKPGEKQRFEFYNILPGGKDAAAPANSAPVASDAGKDNPAPASNDSFYLQAGAFQKEGDADNLKGKLALVGVESSVIEANIPDKGKMFRVRSGPYANADEMNRVRNQMSQGGIQATVIKIKE
jgi:cell division protein FtsN